MQTPSHHFRASSLCLQHLLPSASIQDAQQWLHRNRFSQFCRLFASFSGERLSKLCLKPTGILETLSKAGYLPKLALRAWSCGFVLGTQNGMGHQLTLADLGQVLRLEVLPLEVCCPVCLGGRPIWVSLSRSPTSSWFLSAWVGPLSQVGQYILIKPPWHLSYQNATRHIVSRAMAWKMEAKPQVRRESWFFLL